MIALIDQKISREDVEPFIQEIKIYVGERKELSEEMKNIKRQDQICATYQGTLCFFP